MWPGISSLQEMKSSSAWAILLIRKLGKAPLGVMEIFMAFSWILIDNNKVAIKCVKAAWDFSAEATTFFHVRLMKRCGT